MSTSLKVIADLERRIVALEAAQAAAPSAPQTPAGGVGEPAFLVTSLNSAGGGLTNPVAGSFAEEAVTDEMVEAGLRANLAPGCLMDLLPSIYRAMRAVAPRQPTYAEGYRDALQAVNRLEAKWASAPANAWAAGYAAFRKGIVATTPPLTLSRADAADWCAGWQVARDRAMRDDNDALPASLVHG